MLAINNLSVTYGQMTALRDFSLQLSKSEIVCVIGPNGAGKSTFMQAIAGGVVPDSGSVTFNDEQLIGQRPDAIAKKGISLVPEGRHIFSMLTVEENLRIGGFIQKDKQQARADIERCFEYFPRLAERREFPAGRLSGGEQQMLAIGRALMTRPSMIMLDEPSLGLAPKIVEHIYETLTELRNTEGLTLLVNEQSSNRILKYADRILVLRNGSVRMEGQAKDLQDGEAIKKAYFGFAHDAKAEVQA